MVGQDADEEVDEERFKLILAQLLLLVEAVHHQITQQHNPEVYDVKESAT